MKHLSIFLLLTSCTYYAMCQPGSLDMTFDSDGIDTTGFGINPAFGNDIVVQSDGKIVVVGTATIAGDTDFLLYRINSDGSIDNSFSSDGRVILDAGDYDDGGNAVALQTDGKILMAGYSGFQPNFYLSRWNTDGTIDTSFSGGSVDPSITAFNDQTEDVLVQSDGKILMAGYAWGDANYDFAIVRYLQNGDIDLTFNFDGIVTTDFGDHDWGESIALQSDGKIVVAGFSYNGSSGINNDFAIARYNVDGSLDNTFGTGGILLFDFAGDNDYCYSIAVQPDQKIVLGGYIETPNGTDFALARLNSNGSLDETFGNNFNGKTTTDFAGYDEVGNNILIQNDGNIILSGFAAISSSNDFDFAIVRYNSSGIVDNSFDIDGKVFTELGSSTDYCYSSAFDDDDNQCKLLLVGTTNNTFTDVVAVSRYETGIIGPCFTSDDEEIQLNSSIDIFPVPNDGNFLIRLSTPSIKPIAVTVFNSYGALIKAKNFDSVVSNQVLPINISNFPEGIYLVRVNLGSSSIDKKVTIIND